MNSVPFEAITAACERHGIDLTEDALAISICEQNLYHLRSGAVHHIYRVSTGKNPPSCIVDSGGTPTGLHRVCERIGDGEPLGMVFEGRRPTGRIIPISTAGVNEPNRITTRILRLIGLEPGHNNGPGCDSFERFIYIHGTNREDRIGTPTSAGCIVLRNTDMLALFDATPLETVVWIADELKL